MMTAFNTEVEPLAVKPRVAWQMLQCSNTRGYELLNRGELQSFRDGGSRKITVESIKNYVARQLDAERARAPDGGTAKRVFVISSMKSPAPRFLAGGRAEASG